MLDDRKAAILKAVVEEYIQTAQPVGSGAVSRIPELSVSSATVRNEMGFLEREGSLAQPHTSAGRIPTDKGYRFFVDSITEPTGFHNIVFADGKVTINGNPTRLVGGDIHQETEETASAVSDEDTSRTRCPLL